ncbi:hypothetical protein LWI29_000553 [Acer saccharum]|uniref:Uncharacterized protein n=1 Tax=Acer saccharum TaxID=4024 RepID=A0AA39RBQ3_ACESA|nr:hypothetical protein LWI29_000553 [Acer saccharum]
MLPRPDPTTCAPWLSLVSPIVTIPVSRAHSLIRPAVHETPRQISLHKTRAQAAAPTPSQPPTAATSTDTHYTSAIEPDIEPTMVPPPSMPTQAFVTITSHPTLHAFFDADCANSQDDRSFTSAYVIFLESNAISWCSCKQRSIAMSSTEFEYRVVATAASEVIWLSSLLREM